MEPHAHTLASLIEQLGLNSQTTSIEHFINDHKGIPGDVELHQAEFWNASQAAFLKQMKEDDADWAGVIDQLDVMLR